MRLLLIEDDAETAAFIDEALRGQAHELQLAVDGRDGLICAVGGGWEVIIVDRMLPALDGLSIVRTLRATGSQVPVLFLTTLDGIDDRVEGLNAGADDYLVKPFAMAELIARIAALGRRRERTSTVTHLRVADLEMDLLDRSVRRAAEPVMLQPREFRLLEHLMRHEGEVLTRTMLLERVWDFHFDPNTNIVESHVSRLRDKLGRHRPELIHTVRGSGYMLRAPDRV
ncbi:response regulator transcription factor [Lichenicoccus roseus]|uniref:Response regulator transcription factor n=1 Tax=Lichenicoccus roseus TaxID=2683649 RepID=A0A5R9J100_9PROT|nr:response regulator transcription factor [Lichenicoccus roseus]TLU71212.1 response regulator transcription factor [Lichenicoccus roseus]